MDSKEEIEREEASDAMERLMEFTRDREVRPSHEGALLPGEEQGQLLKLLRACQAAAWNDDDAGSPSEISDEDEEASPSEILDEGEEAFSSDFSDDIEEATPSDFSDEDEEPSPSDWFPDEAEAETKHQPAYFHTSAPWRSYQYENREVDDQWKGPPSRRRRKRRLKHELVGFDEPEDVELSGVAAFVNRRPDFGSYTNEENRMREWSEEACENRGEQLQEQEVHLETEEGVASFVCFKHGRLRHQHPHRVPQALHLDNDEMPEWKGGAEKGQAWRDGKWFCIPMTVCHGINNALGKVDNVHTLWGGILGHSVGNSQDLLDLYARQLQLYQDHDPCRQRILPASIAMPSVGGLDEIDRPQKEKGWR